MKNCNAVPPISFQCVKPVAMEPSVLRTAAVTVHKTETYATLLPASACMTVEPDGGEISVQIPVQADALGSVTGTEVYVIGASKENMAPTTVVIPVTPTVEMGIVMSLPASVTVEICDIIH